ncbi:L-rhamnose mutarotase [Streptomyces malaysiensis]|uniref:L-rhamnose mutarotase n=1 Tax=Streptomyces malaysiensis subsp. samsunensis TaxID=459658 RepID=A0A9X2RR44_STRMQ|nr:L-rhamnose mutarotase [Streptomyces samsunensis]MCQ8827832.1 L-rhamnose mutarotase [Streptomyces samsunensis]
MRVALHSVLKEGQESGYEQAHATVPEDLPAALRRAGITDWRIWRSGGHLFHLVDCEDFAAAMAALDEDPANQRWQEFIGAYVDHFEDTGGSPAESERMALGEVWQLSAQAKAPSAGRHSR